MEPTLSSDKSSLPDTIKQMDNQTCKARTRATMQRLLHGLGTQVLGHVQVASPQAPFFPKVPICWPPPFEEKVKIFCTHKTFSPVVDRDSGWAGGKGASLSPKYHRECDIGANKKKKKKIMIHEWFGILINLGNLEILEILDNLDILG